MTNLLVYERSGAVVLVASGKVDDVESIKKEDVAVLNFILKPDEAETIGEQMARDAYKARTGKTPDSNSVIAERIKGKMLFRCAHVIKNLQDKNKSPEYIANEVVNLILSEAL